MKRSTETSLKTGEVNQSTPDDAEAAPPVLPIVPARKRARPNVSKHVGQRESASPEDDKKFFALRVAPPAHPAKYQWKL